MALPIDELARSTLFQNLTPEQLARIVAIADERTLQPAEALFREGEPGDGVYLILSGQLSVLRLDRSRSERTLATLGPGSVVGEMSLLREGAPRSATARAQTSTRLVRVPSSRMFDLLGADDIAALKIVRNVAGEISRRLVAMNERILDSLARTKKEELGDFAKILSDWSF